VEEALAEASRRVAAGEARQEAVEEALLQGHLFVGYPATLAALERWRDMGHPAPAGRVAGPDERRERGERLCRAVYGTNYDKLRSNVRRLHPDMDRWMVEEGYGRVLGRPGLGLVVRELCVVALLARTGHGPQLHSHLRGALSVGASPEQVEAALRIAADGEAPDRALPEAWTLYLQARGGAGGESDNGAHG
jgi:4-carboxymuconolactone decarboxylase